MKLEIFIILKLKLVIEIIFNDDGVEIFYNDNNIRFKRENWQDLKIEHKNTTSKQENDNSRKTLWTLRCRNVYHICIRNYCQTEGFQH